MQSILSFLVETAYPDAGRDPAAVTEPCRTLRVLGLIHTLIDYAKQLIETATTHAGTPAFASLARPFGTDSLKLLIARLCCAIARATRLEQKLAEAARLGPKYARFEWEEPAADRVAPARRAGIAAPAVRQHHAGAAPPVDPELAHLPSAAQIAAEIRRQPMQQVLATICRDLGITPDHELWQALDQALAPFGVTLQAVAAEEPKPETRRATDNPCRAQRSDAPQPTQPDDARQRRQPLGRGPPPSAQADSAA